jgi:threonine/homoserine/homoserine lactone efflux protein
VLTFAAAFFLTILSPGPGVLTTAGVGAAFGFSAGFRYVTGLFIGTNLVGLAVVTGLGAAVLGTPVLRTILFVLSTAYFIYLAIKIAFAGSTVGITKAARQPGIVDGLILQALNPKAYVVNTVFFTGFAFMPDAFLAEIALKFLIMNMIWIPIHLAWLWAGTILNRLDLSPKAQRRINAFMALAMLVAVALAVRSAL